MAATTLSGYYSSMGQQFPSLASRAQIYEKQGLGSASSYTGSISQNTALLNTLQSEARPTSTAGTTQYNIPSLYSGTTTGLSRTPLVYAPGYTPPVQASGGFTPTSTKSTGIGGFLGGIYDKYIQPVIKAASGALPESGTANILQTTSKTQTPTMQGGMSRVPTAYDPNAMGQNTLGQNLYLSASGSLTTQKPNFQPISGPPVYAPPTTPISNAPNFQPMSGPPVYVPPPVIQTTEQPAQQIPQQPVQQNQEPYPLVVTEGAVVPEYQEILSGSQSSAGGSAQSGTGASIVSSGGGPNLSYFSAQYPGGAGTRFTGSLSGTSVPDQYSQQYFVDQSGNIIPSNLRLPGEQPSQPSGGQQLPPPGFMLGPDGFPIPGPAGYDTGWQAAAAAWAQQKYGPQGNLQLSASGDYYKVGDRVFRSSDNAPLGQEDLFRLGLNIGAIQSKPSVVGSTGGQFDATGGVSGMPSGTALRAVSNLGSDTTQEEFDNYIEFTRNDPGTYTSADAISRFGPAGNTQLSQSGRFYRVGNEIYDSQSQGPDGKDHMLNEDEFHYLGLNASMIGSRQKAGGDGLTDGIFDGWSSGDSGLQKQIDDLEASMLSLSKNDPFIGKTIGDKRKGYESTIKSNGKTRQELVDEATSIQNELNNELYVRDLLVEEISKNPNFSTAKAKKWLGYVDEKANPRLTLLQRQLDLVTNQLGDIDKRITTYVNDDIADYNIYKDRRSLLQSELDNLRDRADERSNNARTTMNILIQNPSLLKDITDQELAYIKNNGTFPVSLLKKVGKDSGLDIKTIFYTTPSSGLKNIYAVTDQGNVMLLETVSDVSDTDGELGAETYALLASDISRYQSAIAAVLEDQGLSDAQKTAQASSLLGEILTKYGASNSAVGIIKESFQNVPTLSQQLGTITTGDLSDEFNTDLSGELSNVNSGWLGKAGRAQRSQERLLAKYPKYTSTIKAAFAPYLK